MTLKKVSNILVDAAQKKYGVAAFNLFNFESISWLIEAAEEEKMPVIAMLYPACSDYIPASTFVSIVRDLAANSDIDVGLHYDHSSSYSGIMEGIKNKFPSVMIDGSSLEFSKNVALTKKVVETAHPLDIDVEAELGYVGDASSKDDFENQDYYTDPEKAVEFVEKTGVDSLAVAIGSAHGNYVSTPNLDLELLEKLNNKLDIPLVLHGGSGIPESQIKKAVKRGINKLNIGTEFNQIFYEKVYNQMDNQKKDNMLACMSAAKEDIKEYFKKKIKLLKN